MDKVVFNVEVMYNDDKQEFEVWTMTEDGSFNQCIARHDHNQIKNILRQMFTNMLNNMAKDPNLAESFKTE